MLLNEYDMMPIVSNSGTLQGFFGESHGHSKEIDLTIHSGHFKVCKSLSIH